jgi:hypothetical protein
MPNRHICTVICHAGSKSEESWHYEEGIEKKLQRRETLFIWIGYIKVSSKVEISSLIVYIEKRNIWISGCNMLGCYLLLRKISKDLEHRLIELVTKLWA